MATPLADRLRERIEAEGPLRFAAFMEAALYDPDHGYYTDPDFTTGRRGDFATAPDVGPVLGATLARPVRRLAEGGGRLVELGPGSGRLVVDLLEALPEAAREALDVVLVEPAARRRSPLREDVAERTGVEPTVVGDVADLEPARTFLVANEVLDALPVDVLEAAPEGPRAMHVTVGEEGLRPTWRPADEELVRQAGPALDRLPEGGRYELARGLEELLSGVAEALDPGVATVLDYGGRFEDLWAIGTEGTLRGFRGHRTVDPLETPGSVDVTADVDFSRVTGVAEALGLDPVAYGGQDRLLVHLGLVEVARERDRLDDVKRLVVPGRGGFGERFRALVLDRGGLADELDLAVDLDDPDVWTEALRALADEDPADPGLGGIL